MTTQIATDTELSAVNSILGSIGQAPITTLGSITTDVTNTGQEIANTYANPQVGLIYNILIETNKNVQNEGWHFNKEDHVEISPNSSGEFLVPNNYLRMDLKDGQYDRAKDVVRKNGKLYDNVHHTYIFSESSLEFDITYLFPFADVPPAIQRYIIARSAVKAATQVISNPELVRLLQLEEAQTRATALEYECEQGDHSFFGFPPESNYRSYQPYKSLIR